MCFGSSLHTELYYTFSNIKDTYKNKKYDSQMLTMDVNNHVHVHKSLQGTQIRSQLSVVV